MFDKETFRTIKGSYCRTARDLIEMYYNDALINGLSIDRNQEEEAVELFAANIVEAGHMFLETPMETPFIPNWSRIQSADPYLLKHLLEAVAADGMDYRASVRLEACCLHCCAMKVVGSLLVRNSLYHMGAGA